MAQLRRRVLVYHGSDGLTHDLKAEAHEKPTSEKTWVKVSPSGPGSGSGPHAPPGPVQQQQQGGGSGDSVAISDTAQAEIVLLQHPRTGRATCYLVIDRRSVQELHWYKQSLSSWFIGDAVCEDGSLYLASPIDPLLLLLPVLDSARFVVSPVTGQGVSAAKPKGRGGEKGVFRSLQEMLFLEGFPGYAMLEELWKPSLPLICHARDAAGTTYYRLDDTRASKWLKCKVLSTANALKKHGGTHLETLDESASVRYAVGLLMEYVPQGPWQERLCALFKLSTDQVRAASVIGPHPGAAVGSLALRSDSPVSTVSSPPSGRTPAVEGAAGSSASAKRKAAAAANTPKITSFFSRPR